MLIYRSREKNRHTVGQFIKKICNSASTSFYRLKILHERAKLLNHTQWFSKKNEHGGPDDLCNPWKLSGKVTS